MTLAKDVEELGLDFWAWRTLQQPRSHDDIPRLERPENWHLDPERKHRKKVCEPKVRQSIRSW